MLNKTGLLNIVAVGILAVVVLGMFGDVIFSSDPLVAAPASAESLVLGVPARVFAFSEIANGRFPLWNPYVFSGIPFFPNIEMALLYPANWLHLVMPVSGTINAGIVLHLILGGLFMYFWAASRGLRVWARLVPAFLFVFSAPQFLFVHTAATSNLYTLIWAPLLFLVIDKLFDECKPGWIMTGMFAVAMQIFAGHAQFLFYTGVAAVLYFLFNAAVKRPALSRLMRISGGFICVYLGAVALSAVQLFPALGLNAETARGQGATFEFASFFSFPPENFLTLLAPGFFGDNIRFPYWGRWLLWEMLIFIGISGLLLAVFGAVCGRKRTKVLSGMAVICSVLAMGAYTPLFKLLYDLVPGFNLFRGNAKFMFLTAMFLAMLAGTGFDRILEIGDPAGGESDKDTGKQRMGGIKGIAVSALVLGAIMLAGTTLIETPFSGQVSPMWRSYMEDLPGEEMMPFAVEFCGKPRFVNDAGVYAVKGLMRGAIVLFMLSVILFLVPRYRRLRYAIGIIVLLEITMFARTYRVTSEMFELGFPKEVARFFKNNPGDYRIFSRLPRMYENMAMVNGISFICGEMVPLKRYAEFMFFTQGFPPGEAGGFILLERYNRLYGMLRCRYLVLPGGTKVEDLPLVHRGKEFDIYGTPSCLPQTFLVDNWRVLNSRDEIFSVMADPSFDPGSEVILEEIPLPAPETAAAGARLGEVEVTETSTNYLVVKAELSRPAILVLTETYAPGWRAVDLSGKAPQEYRVIPANYVLRAVPLAAGKHHLRIEYSPPGFRMGIMVSIIAWVLFLAGCVVLWIRRRREGADQRQKTRDCMELAA